MKRFAYTLAGCAAGLIIGLGLAGCVVIARADGFEVEISHRQILDKTCFWTTNAQGEATTLSCVKD